MPEVACEGAVSDVVVEEPGAEPVVDEGVAGVGDCAEALPDGCVGVELSEAHPESDMDNVKVIPIDALRSPFDTRMFFPCSFYLYRAALPQYLSVGASFPSVAHCHRPGMHWGAVGMELINNRPMQRGHGVCDLGVILRSDGGRCRWRAQWAA